MAPVDGLGDRFSAAMRHEPLVPSSVLVSRVGKLLMADAFVNAFLEPALEIFDASYTVRGRAPWLQAVADEAERAKNETVEQGIIPPVDWSGIQPRTRLGMAVILAIGNKRADVMTGTVGAFAARWKKVAEVIDWPVWDEAERSPAPAGVEEEEPAAAGQFAVVAVGGAGEGMFDPPAPGRVLPVVPRVEEVDEVFCLDDVDGRVRDAVQRHSPQLARHAARAAAHVVGGQLNEAMPHVANEAARLAADETRRALQAEGPAAFEAYSRAAVLQEMAPLRQAVSQQATDLAAVVQQFMSAMNAQVLQLQAEVASLRSTTAPSAPAPQTAPAPAAPAVAPHGVPASVPVGCMPCVSRTPAPHHSAAFTAPGVGGGGGRGRVPPARRRHHDDSSDDDDSSFDASTEDSETPRFGHAVHGFAAGAAGSGRHRGDGGAPTGVRLTDPQVFLHKPRVWSELVYGHASKAAAIMELKKTWEWVVGKLPKSEQETARDVWDEITCAVRQPFDVPSPVTRRVERYTLRAVYPAAVAAQAIEHIHARDVLPKRHFRAIALATATGKSAVDREAGRQAGNGAPGAKDVAVSGLQARVRDLAKTKVADQTDEQKKTHHARLKTVEGELKKLLAQSA